MSGQPEWVTRAETAVRDRLPPWTRTIRFRLALAWSGLLFGAAAIMVTGIYLLLRARLSDDRVTQTVFRDRRVVRDRDGNVFVIGDLQQQQVRTLEQVVNDRTLESLRAYSLWALLALFLASLAIGWWLAGRVLRPVSAITDAAAEISATDLSRRIALQGPDDELRRLADTVDGMLARLDEAFSVQRQLVDDASHELRNPLAITRATLDAVLSREDATVAERTQAVAVISRATDRMTRLVEDLLATARRSGRGAVDLDLGALAAEAVEEARTLAPLVDLRGSAPRGIVVTGDHDALRRAVANLLSNAVRFAPRGVVVCSAGATGGWAWVAVADNGPGVAPEHRGRIFDRFFRVEGHSSSGHAGLGLAIVRQIAESHGGKVALHSGPDGGATFVLWLPVALSPGGAEPGGRGLDKLPVPLATNPLAASDTSR